MALFDRARDPSREKSRDDITRQKNRKISKEISDSKKVAWTAGTPAHGFITADGPKKSESSQRRKLLAKNAMIERGTAAQGVPVRQKRVAELDDDVAVCFLGATRRRRNVIGTFAILNRMQIPNGKSLTRSGAKITRARTQLCVATRRNSRERKCKRVCKERKAHVFSGHGGEAGDYEKISIARAHI